MDNIDSDEPSHKPLTDEALEAFLETVQYDAEAINSRKVLEKMVGEKIATTLTSVNYAPLDIASERYMVELSIEIEKLLQETATRQQLEYEILRSLPSEHELKRAIREWAMMRLAERAHQEGGFLTFLADDLVELELVLQGIQQDTPEYDEVMLTYAAYKKQLYAYWIVRQKFEPDNPLLLAVNQLLPGDRVDPSSEEMVPYFAEAITTLSEKEKRDTRAGEFNQRIYDTLGLNDDNDPTYDKRRAIGAVIAYASLLQTKGNTTSAEREELVREKVREEAPFITQQDLGVFILLINQEYPV